MATMNATVDISLINYGKPLVSNPKIIANEMIRVKLDINHFSITFSSQNLSQIQVAPQVFKGDTTFSSSPFNSISTISLTAVSPDNLYISTKLSLST